MNQRPLPRYTGQEPCRTGDPERFHPEPGNPKSALAAKAECQGCPIRDACLDYALHVGVSGIWGGTSEWERKKLRRKHGIAAEPVVPYEHEQLHEEIQRLNRAGVGPAELSRQFRMNNRSVVRILAAGRAERALAS